MKVLGFDTETTGLAPETDEVTEVGAVTFDTDAHTAVRISGYLVKTKTPVSAEITRLTGITQGMLDNYGVPSKAGLEALLRQAKDVHFFCAHNADFDKGFLTAWCKREGLEMPTTPWIDTRTDLPSAAYQLGKSASLKYLACDHNFLYPAHRAVNDVMAMLTIFDMYPLDEIIKRAQTPNIRVRAVVSYDDRLLAKEAGFYWIPDRKRWEMNLKASDLVALKEKCTFPIVQVEAE